MDHKFGGKAPDVMSKSEADALIADLTEKGKL